MTIDTHQKKKSVRSPSGAKTIPGLLGIFSLLLVLRNSDLAIEYMNRGLLLCAKTVVPSLFPFMVLSEMIVSGGFGAWLLQKCSKPMQKAFRLSPDGCCAVLLGMLCGFPIGAKCAVLSWKQQAISKEEAERVLAFSNNPSSAFLISAVGGSLWGNPRFGFALYLCVILSSLLTGILFAHLPRKKEAPFPLTRELPRARLTNHPVRLFCQSIRSALESMLLVCAYVVFFSALLGTVQFLPLVQNLSNIGKAALFCIFEISSGVSHAAALGSTVSAALISAAAVAWSGLSVHCQILSVCDGTHLSLRTYFSAKILQTVLCPLLLFASLSLFPSILIPATGC